MKKFYYYLLLTLLIAMGGGETKAQEYDYEEYDFAKWAEDLSSQNIIMGDLYEYDENGNPDLTWVNSQSRTMHYMKSIGSHDVSRFACFYPSDKSGWFFDQGLKCNESIQYTTLAICNLLSGDELILDYTGGLAFLGVVYGNAINDKKGSGFGVLAKEENLAEYTENGTVTIKLTADCDLFLTNTSKNTWDIPILKKVTIKRKRQAGYDVDDTKDYDTPYYDFTSPGKINNEDRVIKDIFGITVTLGNINKTNNVEVVYVEGEGKGCGVQIFDDNNLTWLWKGDDKTEWKTVDYYKQGTFYVLKPTVDGTLYFDGYCKRDGETTLTLDCFKKEKQDDDSYKYVYVESESKDNYSSSDLSSGISLQADHIYYLYANNADTYCLQGFTYESNFQFLKQSVVIRGELKKNEKDIVTKVGDVYTYYAENDYYYEGKEDANERGQVIQGDNVTYSFEAKGDGITIIYGEDKTDETGGTKVSWKVASQGGGAIVVTATHSDVDNDDENEMETTQYVITIPYKTKEWVFEDTENKEELYANTANNKLDWDLAWKVFKHNDNSTIYTELERPVFSNSVKVEGDNARFIDATAGLIFEASSKHFGTNIEVTPAYYRAVIENKKEVDRFWIINGEEINKNDITERELSNHLYNVWKYYKLEKNVDPEVKGKNITIQKGAKLTIPNLEKGQHIRFRWNRHNDNIGDKMKAYNVTDLIGNDMDNKEFYAGQGSNNGDCGHLEFIAKGGDATFELLDNGWLNIIDIRVGEVGEYLHTHLRPMIKGRDAATNAPLLDKTFADETVKDGQDLGNEWGFFNRDAIHIYLHKKGQALSAAYSQGKEDLHTQSCHSDTYHILGDKSYEKEIWGDSRTGTLTADNCKITDKGELTIDDENAHGSFVLVVEGSQNGYVLDSIHVKIKVFEYAYNEKEYPYTWAMEHFTTDTRPNDNTIDKIDNDGQYWEEGETKNENGFALKHRIFRVGYPENMIALKRRERVNPEARNVRYSLKEGDAFAAGTTVDMGVVALTYGVKGGASFVANKPKGNEDDSSYTIYTEGNGENGNENRGTVYTIVPQHKGNITIAVVLNAGNPFYITENGEALSEYNGIKVNDKKYGTFSFDVQAGKTYKIYATGTKLGFYGFSYTYNIYEEEFIPEFDGLGFIPVDYWDHHDMNVQLEPAQNGIKFSKMGDNPDKNKGYRLIVPKVGVNQTLYLAVTDDTNESVKKKNIVTETVTEKVKETVDGEEVETEVEKQVEKVVYDPVPKANEDGKQYNVYVDTYEKGIGKDNNYDKGGYNPTNFSIYKIDGEGNDVELMLKDLTVHKVAVSVDTKRVAEAGYATEAREYPIDFTLAKLFLGTEQKAYKVTGVTDETDGKQYVTISEVRYIPATTVDGVRNNPEVNNGVMITGDYLPERANRKETYWPLFTTDIDRATSDMTGNRLIGVVNNDNIAKVDQRTRYEGDNDSYYNYMLAEAGYNVVYNDEGDGDGYHDNPGVADGTIVIGLGFYLVMKEGTIMSGGKEYQGGKPINNSAYLQLEQRLAKKNEFNNSNVSAAGIRQVFFIDADSIVTDIDEVLIDDDELPKTEENNSANILKNGVFYTLQGVPVKNPTKGIYIFNGKKVYVK